MARDDAPPKGFVVLPKRLLLMVCATYLLVISPALLESPLPQLTIALLALCAAVFPKIHALGLSLIGLPALVALLLTNGDASARSWAALLAMLEFYVLEQVFWGLAEEAPQPWWGLVLVWLLMPSTLGILGLGLLLLLCHQRWHGGLAVVRHTQKQSRRKDWLWVIGGLLVVTAMGFVLPAPSQNTALPDIPSLGFSGPTPTPNTTPNLSDQNNSLAPRQGGFGGINTDGLLVVAFLMVGYLFFVWRKLQLQAPPRLAARAATGWLWLGLLILSGMVLLTALLGLVAPPTKSLLLPSATGNFSWLALLFFLVFIVWWRIAQRQRLTPNLSLKASDNGLEGLRHLLPEDAVRAAYYRWLLWLRDLELPRSPTQTPQEFLQMVCTQHPTMRSHSQTLTAAYERVRYGKTPSHAELEQTLSALEQWQLEVKRALPEDVSLPVAQMADKYNPKIF